MSFCNQTSRSVGWEYLDVHTDVRTPGVDLPVPVPRGTPWTLTERSVEVSKLMALSLMQL